MNTHADVIVKLGGYRAVAQALDVSRGRVSVWKTRKRIPAEHWLDIAQFAEQSGVGEVTLDVIKKLSVERKIARAAA